MASGRTFDLVYFRIILSESGENGDIISIAAKHGDRTFSVWIRPSKPVPSTARPIKYGLRLRYLDWFFQGKKLRTVNLDMALDEFVSFLMESPRKVILVGYFAYFPIIHLMRAIQKTEMIDSFNAIIGGVVDAVKPLSKKFTNRRRVQQYSLPVLCRDFLYAEYVGHWLDSIYALSVLENLVSKEISTENLFQAVVPFRKINPFFLEFNPLARISPGAT